MAPTNLRRKSGIINLPIIHKNPNINPIIDKINAVLYFLLIEPCIFKIVVKLARLAIIIYKPIINDIHSFRKSARYIKNAPKTKEHIANTKTNELS